MRSILEKIISLAEARNVEEDELLAKFDPNGLGISNLNSAFMQAPRPQQDELASHLSQLTQDQLEYIATVMYGGRDYLVFGEKPKFDFVLAGIKGDPNLDDLISEKVPLPEYLRAGMKIYKI